MERINRTATAIRVTSDDSGVWLGEVTNTMVRGVRLPLDQAHHTHAGQGMHSEKRWRYREDGDAVFWWGVADLTDADKRAVEKWLAERGIHVRRHLGNTQRIAVDDIEMFAFEFSHGGGPRPARRIRVIDEHAGEPVLS